eukprot:CAMPEP_0174348190 /NCGR_PEP_ID=MMETSP0811_2-20130205/4564_1 /TAXON_ID=73025 ORGANISM="Eutreptiella gymnastica-like, Strain CCMP1594" /NCGR_SAMPLE_ID=MMETSP0811_2 /ASSEMBLY_ACC=CAM_ASM_000667 /LENGTH=55 /DNA_ID=CAMNT_0015474495 /DNA_START=165 /DNA_END=332 /DNA_ORIENTATION=+
MTFSGLEPRYRMGQEATQSTNNTKPHMVLRVIPPVDLKSYLRTKTKMLCAHLMPL